MLATSWSLPFYAVWLRRENIPWKKLGYRTVLILQPTGRLADPKHQYLWTVARVSATCKCQFWVKTSPCSGKLYRPTSWLGDCCLSSHCAPRTHSKVANWNRRRKVRMDVGLYPMGYHWTSNLFNALQFEHGVARSNQHPTHRRDLLRPDFTVHHRSNTDLRWIPKMHPNLSMGMLLLSIAAAQILSNPDRESKERQRDFVVKYTTHSFINLFGFNQSNTASELRTYLENRLVETTTPVHIMWFEQSKANRTLSFCITAIFSSKID